jgi:D-glycero-beta-D-manno-heptose-7-phosphate kinase
MDTEAIIKRLPKLAITVWGDLVADEFIAGEIARVSREAPVLILKQRTRSVVPGGGGNTAMNLAALGVKVRLIGAVGDDEPGRLLARAFAKAGIDTRDMVKLRGWATPTKTRILAHHAHTSPQQVVRMDREPDPMRARDQERLAVAAARAARATNGILVADYGYGAVGPAAVRALRTKMPRALIAADARFALGEYRGLNAATPNEAELEAAEHVAVDGDLAVLERAGRKLRRTLGCEHLLVTRGRDGMALFEPGKPTRHLAVVGSDRALDVTGAGDTVIAVFTAALAAGADGLEAAALANRAASVVVMKPGTATCSLAELRHSGE